LTLWRCAVKIIITFSISDVLLCDVRRVAVALCFKLKVFLNIYCDITPTELNTGWSKKRTPVIFLGNFGNSAPILTVLSLLPAEIYGA